MKDGFQRNIDYLRISLTDRCNLRCRYCMPEEGIEKKEHADMLSLEQIARVVRIASETAGISKIRLTGGEPLVRKGIHDLIHQISRLPGIEEVSLTTNGILFASQAEKLKAAGLKRVNFSMDTLREDRFLYITRGGKLQQVKDAVERAIALEFLPVKINVVAMQGFNDDEILDFADWAYREPLHIRFIECMPVGNLPFYSADKVLPLQMIRQKIESRYALLPVQQKSGAGPAECFSLAGGSGLIGFIGAMTHHFCDRCNRLRLTADGRLRPCLYSQQEINIKNALDSDAADAVIAQFLQEAVQMKPAEHQMEQGWGEKNTRKMYQIGG